MEAEGGSISPLPDLPMVWVQADVGTSAPQTKGQGENQALANQLENRAVGRERFGRAQRIEEVSMLLP